MAGITTVHDWAHNIRGTDDAHAGLRALEHSGLRARFSFGYQQGEQNERLMALDDLAALASAWPEHSAQGRIGLGMAWGDWLLGPDLQVVHMNNASPQEITLAAAHDAFALTARDLLSLATIGGARLLVTAAQPVNVDTVIADGRVLKRGGMVTGYDVAELAASARSALAGVPSRVG